MTPISAIWVCGSKVTFCWQAVAPPFSGIGVMPNSGAATGVGAITTRSFVAHGIQRIAAITAKTASGPSMRRLAIEPRQRQPQACDLQQRAHSDHDAGEHMRRASRKRGGDSADAERPERHE